MRGPESLFQQPLNFLSRSPIPSLSNYFWILLERLLLYGKGKHSLPFFFFCHISFYSLRCKSIMTVHIVEPFLSSPHGQRSLPSTLLTCFPPQPCWYPNKTHFTPCVVNSIYGIIHHLVVTQQLNRPLFVLGFRL